MQLFILFTRYEDIIILKINMVAELLNSCVCGLHQLQENVWYNHCQMVYVQIIKGASQRNYEECFQRMVKATGALINIFAEERHI